MGGPWVRLLQLFALVLYSLKAIEIAKRGAEAATVVVPAAVDAEARRSEIAGY